MRILAITADALVALVLVVPAAAIADDGSSATIAAGPATIGELSLTHYDEWLYAAPAGGRLVAAETGQIGWTWTPDGGVAAPVVTGAAFAALQASLCADIDRQAQAQRDLYVAPGGAQAATYMFKQTQAVQAQAAQTTSDAGKTAEQLAALYPDLANEIGITRDPSTGAPATDVYGVMRAVIATLQVWLPLNRGIEATRLRTKAAINAATTAAAAQAAHDGAAWPSASREA